MMKEQRLSALALQAVGAVFAVRCFGNAGADEERKTP